MKQKLADLKGETGNENIIVEDFNTQLSTQKKTTRKSTRKLQT